MPSSHIDAGPVPPQSASAATELAQALCETFDTYIEHTPCEIEQARDGVSLFIATTLVQIRRVCQQCDMPHEAERHVWRLLVDSLTQMQTLQRTMEHAILKWETPCDKEDLRQ